MNQNLTEVIEQVDSKETRALENYTFIESLLGRYNNKLDLKINKIIEDSKQQEYEEQEDKEDQNEERIKVITEEDEYTDVSESDIVDSDSEPSEDNFGEDELEELQKEIKKNQLRHYERICESYLPTIGRSPNPHSVSSNEKYLSRDKSKKDVIIILGKLFREAKKIELYQFSLTPQNFNKIWINEYTKNVIIYEGFISLGYYKRLLKRN